MIQFILNNELLSCEIPLGMTLLDYLRHQRQLTATKESCHQGECGACLVLLGHRENDKVIYQAVTSCLLAMGELQGKHVVTLEGLNQSKLNPIQQAFIEKGAVQCGYCTPGFIIAITEFLLNSSNYHLEEAKLAVSGNICRCTGYQAIKNALNAILQNIKPSDLTGLIEQCIIPDYFAEIPARLANIYTKSLPVKNSLPVGGGTDFFVQHPDDVQTDLDFLDTHSELKGIHLDHDACYIAAETTVAELRHSEIIHSILPTLQQNLKFFAAKPLRQRATLAGNLVNASPIADLSIIFLALNAELKLFLKGKHHSIALKDFFISYKHTAKQAEELITYIKIPLPVAKFHYEKVSKRQYLDIAAVNSALQIEVVDNIIQQIHLAAGGVAPIPLYLQKTIHYLQKKTVDAETIKQALIIAQTEIQPISDIRGSENYKRLLFQQLLIAHFLTLFPQQLHWQDLILTGVLR